MRDTSKYAVSIVGAAALVVSVLTNAFASNPVAQQGAPAGKTQTIGGNLNVNGVVHVKKNQTVYGNLYTRGKAEVYKGLTVRSNGLAVNQGGVKTDTLDVTTSLHAQSGVIDQNLNVTGNVQAATLSGTSLTVSGAASVAGALTTTGKLTASGGIDAGAGAVTTTGALAAGSTSVSSLTDVGSLVANSVQIGSGGLQVTGGVDFTHATVTGLSLSNIIGTGNLTLANLTLGSPTSTGTPLFLAANGKTATITVDASGNVVLPALSTGGSAVVAGSLAVQGSSGITASSLSAPLNGSNAITPLALAGSTITLTGDTTIAGALTENGTTTLNSLTSLNGSTTLNGNSNLNLAATTGAGATASHVVGNKDVDGQVTVSLPTGVGEQTVLTAFTRSYVAAPTVVVTATEDPAPWATSVPKVWVTLHTTAQGLYDGFTLHYVPPAPGPAAATAITYNYHVIG